MNSNQRVTHVIRHENGSGVQMLIGFVALMIVLRLWWTGILGDWFAIFSQPKDGSLSSVTFFVVSFLAELVSGCGVVLVMIWSGLWFVINDIIAGFRELAEQRRAKQEITNAVATASVTATVQQPAQAPQPSKVPADPILDALRTIDKNVRATHAVATEAKNQTINLDSRMSELDGRLTAIETVPAPKTTTRKTAAR